MNADERRGRYAAAMSSATNLDAILTLADAEQHELRATITRVHKIADGAEHMAATAVNADARDWLTAFATTLRNALRSDQ